MFASSFHLVRIRLLIEAAYCEYCSLLDELNQLSIMCDLTSVLFPVLFLQLSQFRIPHFVVIFFALCCFFFYYLTSILRY